MVGDSNDNTNFPHKLLLANRQVANIPKAFAYHSSTDIKLSKTQLSKMIQLGGFLGKLLGKLAGPLMKVAMPLAKNVLAPLGLSAAMSAIDGSIKKKMLGSGATTLSVCCLLQAFSCSKSTQQHEKKAFETFLLRYCVIFKQVNTSCLVSGLVCHCVLVSVSSMFCSYCHTASRT